MSREINGQKQQARPGSAAAKCGWPPTLARVLGGLQMVSLGFSTSPVEQDIVRDDA